MHWASRIGISSRWGAPTSERQLFSLIEPPPDWLRLRLTLRLRLRPRTMPAPAGELLRVWRHVSRRPDSLLRQDEFPTTTSTTRATSIITTTRPPTTTTTTTTTR